MSVAVTLFRYTAYTIVSAKYSIAELDTAVKYLLVFGTKFFANGKGEEYAMPYVGKASRSLTKAAVGRKQEECFVYPGRGQKNHGSGIPTFLSLLSGWHKTLPTCMNLCGCDAQRRL